MNQTSAFAVPRVDIEFVANELFVRFFTKAGRLTCSYHFDRYSFLSPNQRLMSKFLANDMLRYSTRMRLMDSYNPILMGAYKWVHQQARSVSCE